MLSAKLNFPAFNKANQSEMRSSNLDESKLNDTSSRILDKSAIDDEKQEDIVLDRPIIKNKKKAKLNKTFLNETQDHIEKENIERTSKINIQEIHNKKSEEQIKSQLKTNKTSEDKLILQFNKMNDLQNVKNFLII